MTDRKAKVGICSFSYGGNGGIRSEVPDVRDWMIETIIAAKADKRVSSIVQFDIADTPITMGRNKAVIEAKALGLDFLVMIDSDMKPDCEEGAPKFWDVGFDFVFNHYEKGPSVIAAPYGGPPPLENMYVFCWENTRNNSPDGNFNLRQYQRQEAARMTGITPVAALPTGLIIFDMRIFDVVNTSGNGWFYYEWSDNFASEKGSTEDVTATRDMSLIGGVKLGYNPVYCAWDCWAGHWKPYLVTKPRPLDAMNVGDTMWRSLLNRTKNEVPVYLNLGGEVPKEFAVGEECQTTPKVAVPLPSEPANPACNPKQQHHIWK